jgi:cytochrome c oxidase assembly protein Cox11
MRFQRDVKAFQIRDVEVTAAQTQEVYEGMTETSAFHHEPSLAKPVPTPTPEQLNAFFARLESFCQHQKKTAPAKQAAAGP